MKKIIILSISLLLILTVNSQSQSAKTLPKVNVKDLKGNTIDFSTIRNGDKPMIVDFWATWCVPCIRELNNIHKVYQDWQKETGVKFIAVSIDDARTTKKVAPFVAGRGWKFDFYLDENSDLKRAMGVTNPPHTFIVNSQGEIIWEHAGYAEGGEEEIIKKVRELIESEKK